MEATPIPATLTMNDKCAIPMLQCLYVIALFRFACLSFRDYICGAQSLYVFCAIVAG